MSAQQLAISPDRPSLSKRLRRAGSWTLFGQVAGQAIRLASNIVISRLLAPDTFGMMSVVYMLTMALALFSDMGIGRSVVQSHRGGEPEFLDTAWTLGVLRGCGLGVMTLLIGIGFYVSDIFHWAPASTVYADPRLPWVICAFALSTVISSLESIRIGLAHRDVQVQRLTKMELSVQLVSTVLMVGIAWMTHSVWALVFGGLFTASLRVGFSYLVMTGHRVRFRLEPTALRELMGNAQWIFLSSIMGFIAANGDRVLLGGLIDAGSFGLYAIAVLLISAVQTAAITFCINLAYPALAEVFREREHDLPGTMGKFLLLYDLLFTTVSGLLIVAGPAIVHLLYDHRYHDAGWILSVLAIGAVGMRSQLVEQAYMATGRAKLQTLANLARLLALIGGSWLGYRIWGFAGFVSGVALSQFAAWPLAFAFLVRRKYFTWRGNAAFLPSLLGGMLLGWLIREGILWLLPAGHSTLKSMLH